MPRRGYGLNLNLLRLSYKTSPPPPPRVPYKKRHRKHDAQGKSGRQTERGLFWFMRKVPLRNARSRANSNSERERQGNFYYY